MTQRPTHALLVTAILASLSLTACTAGPEAEAPPASAPAGLPAGHPPLPVGGGGETSMPPRLPGTLKATSPHGQTARHGTPPVVRVAPDIAAAWKSVELSVIEGGRSQPLRVAIGAEAAVPGSKLSVRVLHYLPAFQIGNGEITSRGNKPENPAALVRLSRDGKPLGEGWIFQAVPDFSTLPAGETRVQLLSASP